MHSMLGNCFSLCDPGTPGAPPCSPIRPPLHSPGATLMMLQTSKTSDSVLHCWQKTGGIRSLCNPFPPFSTSMVLGNSFLRQSSFCSLYFHSFFSSMLSLSLLLFSCYSLHDKCSLPWAASTAFSPMNQLSAFPTFHRSFFWCVNVQLCSLRPAMDLLGIQNDLIFVWLCLREEARLESPYSSTILSQKFNTF